MFTYSGDARYGRGMKKGAALQRGIPRSLQGSVERGETRTHGASRPGHIDKTLAPHGDVYSTAAPLCILNVISPSVVFVGDWRARSRWCQLHSNCWCWEAPQARVNTHTSTLTPSSWLNLLLITLILSHLHL